MGKNTMLATLRSLAERLRPLLDELAALLDGLEGGAAATRDLDVLCDIALALRDVRDEVRDAGKRLNRVGDRVDDHFADRLFQAEQCPYREHPDATFSPSARGHFSVTGPREFLQFLKERGEEDPLGRFLELVTKKTPLRELCEARLEAGEPLPAGVKGHVARSVTIRRKRRSTNDGPTKGDEF